MTEQRYTEVDWEKALSPRAYRALRLGEMETPGTGRYVTTTASGVYHCAGCDAPLFSSEAKIDDGSGYATFTQPFVDAEVSTATSFTESGTPQVGFVCGNCGGRLGDLDDMVLESSRDLEQGTRQHIYHANSQSIVLKKGLTVRNYPVWSALVALTIGILGYMGWSWGQILINVSEFGSAESTIPLWIGEEEVQAKVIRLDQPNASTSGMVLRQGAVLFMVLGTGDGIPAIRFSNHTVDILWLNTDFKVVGWERQRASKTSQPLDPPVGARYAVIAQPGTIESPAFASGYEIILTDRSSLL